MSAKINVLERFRDVLANLKAGTTQGDNPFALRTLEMTERHIDNLEKNQGFGAQKRADIAAQLMSSGFTGVDMAMAAKTAVRGADALLYELNGGNQTVQVWTHREKGGHYEVLGESTGAGTSREEQKVFYRSLTTGKLFHRAPADFIQQMVKAECL